MPGLTGLRGVGAVWVLAFHAQYEMALPVARVGFLGVDMFFILSGFVLSLAHGGDRWTVAAYAAFVRGRFARLFPLHWFTLAFVGVVLLAVPTIAGDMPRVFRPVDLPASIALVQGWGFGRSTVWNLPAWSLSAEWLVSVAFPVFAVAAARVRGPRVAVAGCVACLLGFVAFLHLTGNPDTNVTARAGLVRALCEFAAGCLLHRAYALGLRPGRPVALAGIAFVATGVAVPGLAAAAVFGFPALILLAARTGSGVARVLSTRVMLVLGDLSFSIYLLHWILLQASDRLAVRWGVAGTWWVVPWACGFVALLLLMSFATFHLVEVPARRWLRRAGLPGAPPIPRRGSLRAG